MSTIARPVPARSATALRSASRAPRHPGIGLIACVLLAASASGQKLFDAVNPAPSSIFNMTGPNWYAHKRSNPAPVTLTAAEFLLVNWNAPSVTLEIGIWDENPANGQPRNLLGSGLCTVPQDVPGYYGVRFSQAVHLPAAGSYFVAVKTPNAIVAFARGGGVITPYWFGGGSSWTGPVTDFGISFRVYADAHAGGATSFGAGKPGTRGLPELDGAGWPNTTNPYGFRLTHAAIGVPCLFLIGSRTAIATPFATVWATPLIMVSATTRSAGTGRGDGFAELGFTVPDDPALAGGRLACQVLIADPAATFGVAHTPGLEVLLGH